MAETTIPQRLLENLGEQRKRAELLDGDVARPNRGKGLGFCNEDRGINIRRIAFVCNLLARVDRLPSLLDVPYRKVGDEVKEGT